MPRLLLLSALLAVIMPPLQAATHALVVGINQYAHGVDMPPAPDSGHIQNLRGAVNDARLIRDALAARHVEVPDSRFLLNERATLANFQSAWAELIARAKPGDTLLLTWAGHGGQRPDLPPLDEDDHKDEMFLFHDFDPRDKKRGSLSDDAMFQMFEREASAFKIVLVVDACHAGGMARGGTPLGRSRSYPDAWGDPEQDLVAVATQSGDGQMVERLPNLTFISANDNEAMAIHETLIEGMYHGALSYHFARALRGAGNYSGDDWLNRGELYDYLVENVRRSTNNWQHPRLIPLGGQASLNIFTVEKPAQTGQIVPQIPPVAIRVIGGDAPAGLRDLRQVTQDPLLEFRIDGAYATVFNTSGDRLTGMPARARDRWQAIIDKQRFIRALDAAYDPTARAAKITLREGDGEHRQGEVLHFGVLSADPERKALTLFNLAGSGEIQYLYPVRRLRDSAYVQYPYALPPLKVTPPFGGDDLVAVVCQHAPEAFQRQLQALEGNSATDPQALMASLEGRNCQVGRYAFFSVE